jgi:hypothetical protein
MSARVFISYAREDQEFVLRLANELRTRGISIWLDQWDILPGADWDQSIDRALHESERFIVILSPAAVTSRQVRAEIQAAVDTAKAVFPVLYKDCEVPRVIRLYQFLDFRDDHEYSQTLKRLAEALRGEKEPALSWYPPSTASRIWRTWRLTLATAAAVALVSGLLLFIFSPFSGPIHTWISNLPSSSNAPSTTSRKDPSGSDSPALPVLPPVTTVPAPPGTLSAPPQVEGLGVKIVSVRRSRDRGATFVDLYYSVTTGADFSRHDPIHFVQLIADGVALTPVWASAPARDLPSNSRQDILVRFPSPPRAASIVFRFGEEHYLDLLARVAE